MVLFAHALVQDEAFRRLAAVVAALELVVADGLQANVDLRVVDLEVVRVAARLRLADDGLCRGDVSAVIVSVLNEWNKMDDYYAKELQRALTGGRKGSQRCYSDDGRGHGEGGYLKSGMDAPQP